MGRMRSSPEDWEMYVCVSMYMSVCVNALMHISTLSGLGKNVEKEEERS